MKQPQKMTKLSCIIIVLVLTAQFGFAQEAPLNTDRPGKAFSTQVVGKSFLLLQSGVDIHGSKTKSGPEERSLGYTSFTDVRYGLSRFLEVHTSIGVGADETTTEDILPTEPDIVENSNGLSFLSVGFRTQLLNPADHNGHALTFRTDVELPWTNDSYGIGTTNLHFQFSHGINILDNWGLTTNLGYRSTEGLSDFSYLNYIFNLTGSVSDQWSVFGEVYGSYYNELVSSDDFSGRLDVKWDAGVALSVNPRFQWDGSFGVTWNNEETSWFVDSGITWRIID